MRTMVVAAVLMVAVVVATTAVAQEAPGPLPGPGGPAIRPEAPAPGGPEPGAPGWQRTGPPIDPEQMMERMAERIGLTEAEKAAVRNAVRAKIEAANALGRELRALGEVARNQRASDKELAAALRRFDAALATYRQKVKAIDAQLVKALSLRARAALTVLGVLDNGLGGRFGMRVRMGETVGSSGPGQPGGWRRRPGRQGSQEQGSQGPQVIR